MKYANINEDNKLLGWYDSYIHEIIPKPNIEVSNEDWQIAIDNNHNKINEDGTTEFYDFRTEADIINENEEKAKFTRDTVEISNIEVHGVMWQVRDADRTRTKETIDTAYRQNRSEETINWILADNTIRTSTVKDLEDVLDAFSLRREDIFTQYAIWRNGDKLDPFVYNESS